MDDYIYAVARIRSLETKLLTKQDSRKLLEMSTGEEIISFLVSANYGQGAVDIDNTDATPGIENFLQAEINGVRSLLVSLVPVRDAGLIDTADKSMGIVEPPGDWATMLDISRANFFVHNLNKTLIDINNIRTFFNFRFFSVDPSKLIDNMIPGGYISYNWFVDKYSMGLDALAHHIKNTNYGSIGIPQVTTNEPETMSVMDVLFDNYLSEYLSEKTMCSFSDISPLIRYLFLKKQETGMLRTIWYGMENGAPREDIIKHLRGMYA